MAFFDGQNLFQHAKDAFGHFHPNYDPKKLALAVCAAQGWRHTLTRFYTGVPSQIESAMWASYWSNRVLAMKRTGIVVTTRPLRYRKAQVVDANGKPVLEADGKTPKIITTPQEKGIDVRLALDLVSLARKLQFDVALIFRRSGFARGGPRNRRHFPRATALDQSSMRVPKRPQRVLWTWDR